MSIPDPVAEIVAVLKADEGVVAVATAAHVYAAGLPTKGLQMPQAAVVVKPAGGPGRRGRSHIRDGRVDTVCYGASLRESWQLHLAVREALENLERTTGSIFSVSTASDGTNALDPVELWPTCYASYTVMSAVSA